MSSAPPLGLIGIGLLGSVLAQRLLAGGFRVVGHDLDPTRRDLLARDGGEAVADSGEVFRRCRRILLSLPSHREVTEVLTAHASTLQSGSILIDTTTGDPASAAALAHGLAVRGITYLDATVSGSSAQVRDGIAILMVGGNAAAFQDCADLFSKLGGEAYHTGGPGTGAKMKLVTNVVLGLNRAALAEGLALARGLGLDAEQAFAIMSRGPAYSRVMDRKGEKMLRGDFAPEARLSQHLKDVRLILQQGQAAGLPMPLSETHRRLLEAAEAAGLGALDNSAIIQVLGPTAGGPAKE
ncbi:MAG: NAD(P)-dependent oxidoreductase [Verrucomicrobia bacterium]|nr:NAD(P)-dependent oxidoreductase [Verrucomicrobiota bacterium]